MKLIGAGYPKTGTTSTAIALKILGFSVDDHFGHLGHNFHNYCDLLDGAVDEKVLKDMHGNVDVVMDTPAVFFWKDFMEIFPEAKVILTVRDNDEKWVNSVINHVEYTLRTNWWCHQRFYSPIVGALSETTRKIRVFYGRISSLCCGIDIYTLSDISQSPPLGISRVLLRNHYNLHNAAVKATVPEDRLLVFNVKEGWAPLCKFLNKPIPDRPFPRENQAVGDGCVPVVDQYLETAIFDIAKKEVWMGAIKIGVVSMVTLISASIYLGNIDVATIRDTILSIVS